MTKPTIIGVVKPIFENVFLIYPIFAGIFLLVLTACAPLPGAILPEPVALQGDALPPDDRLVHTAVAQTLTAFVPPTHTPTPSPTITPSPTFTLTPAPTSTFAPTPTPPFWEMEIIGFTILGNGLEVYRFGYGPSHRMIVAGIHGGYEWNTVDLAYELIRHLQENPDLIPAEVTLYILPNLNPDGYSASRGYEGRANANNVDLNRNWDAYWQADWPKSGCWDYLPITAGSYPHSEYEVHHLAYFIFQHGLDAVISYHSAGLGIFPGGPTLNSLNLAETLAAVSPYPYPPERSNCQPSGHFVDWAASYGIAAVDVELSTHYNLDWEINLRILDEFLNWQPFPEP